MLFKRDESFRFTFENPVKATFKVLRLNQLNNDLKEGSALIIDLSPNGLRLSSSLDLPINEKKYSIDDFICIKCSTTFNHGRANLEKTHFCYFFFLWACRCERRGNEEHDYN